MFLTRCRKCWGLLGLLVVLLASGITASPPSEEAGASYGVRYQFEPGTQLHYVIENEYRDSGGVPGWLSYSTQVRERRVVVQNVSAPATQPAGRPDRAGKVEITWECDRYEVREKGMKDEVTFDSLRDLYPPPSLYGLGVVHGSKVSFWFDPRTGLASEFKVTPGRVEGPPATTRRLSRTAARCSLTPEVLGDLLYDLGPLFLPSEPQRVGDAWTHIHTDTIEPFGPVVTQLTATLRSVRKVNESDVALIDLRGTVSLQSASATSAPAATAPGVQADGESPITNHAEPVPPDAFLPSTNPASPVPLSEPTTAPARPANPSRAASAPAADDRHAETRPPTSTSRPATATTGPVPPTSAPKSSRTEQKPSKAKNFTLDTAVCTGTVEFDLTRGELVQMTLRREISGASRIEQTSSDPMIPTEIRAGSFHELRVTVSRTPPPKPVIVGGRKPPTIPPDELEPPKGLPPRKTPTSLPSRPPTTTRPAIPTTRPLGQPPPSARLPASTRPSPGRPVQRGPSPATRPAARPPSSRRLRPTSRPTTAPTQTKPGSAGQPAGATNRKPPSTNHED